MVSYVCMYELIPVVQHAAESLDVLELRSQARSHDIVGQGHAFYAVSRYICAWFISIDEEAFPTSQLQIIHNQWTEDSSISRVL